MLGPSRAMDWQKLMQLTMFLLMSTNTDFLHGNPTAGVNHDLRCVNDYLFTVNCSLSITPSVVNSSYWLEFVDDQAEFACMLTNTDEDYFCSVYTSPPKPNNEIFSDLETYIISLCHKQFDEPTTCEVLEEDYGPQNNIKPNPPCCLTVSHNSSHHHFTWNSTYEEYYQHNQLFQSLSFQLHYYKSGDENSVISHQISTDHAFFQVDNEKFVPDTEYTARVRSSPNGASYKGQWSGWSSEVHWKTDVKQALSNPWVFGLSRIFIPLGVAVTLIVLCGYTLLKKWRPSTFIPTPAPYFQTLYRDCQGDFKSWVIIQENVSDMLKAEETLQINTLTKCEDIHIQEEDFHPQFHHQFTEGSAYNNINGPGCDAALLGVPYDISTMVPPLAQGNSLKSLALNSQPGSPTEGDSGCWLCSRTSLEREPPFYCNEYCTLSAFQQASPVIAEHHGSTKFCAGGMDTAEAVTEA